MPRWWVSEPYENLWMEDTPLSYKTSSGQEVDFTFYYRQQFMLPAPDEVPSYYMGGYPREIYTPWSYPPAHPGGLMQGMTNAGWGNNWTMSVVLWDSYWENQIYQNPSYQNSHPPFSDSYEAMVFRPEGGIYYFSSGGPLQNSRTLVQFEPTAGTNYPVVGLPTPDTNNIYWGNVTNGVRLAYPDGSQDIFGLTYYDLPSPTYGAYGYRPIPSDSTAEALLTERIDPQGRVTLVGYENITNTWEFRVKYVVDPDGQTNTFFYTGNTSNAWQLSTIVDPYGQTTSLGYNANNQVSNITDAAGMTSSFTYAYGTTNSWVVGLVTPYGTNTFLYYEQPDASVTNGFQELAILVGEPEGADQLYLYYHNNPEETASATAPTVPSQTFDNGSSPGSSGHGSLIYRNTYHWGPRQFNALSSNVQSALPYNLGYAISIMSTNDFNKADLKHWLLDSADQVSITESLSSERDPSPDPAGQIPGLRTWYNYPSQPSPEELQDLYGYTYSQVQCMARLVPNGTNWDSQYTTYTYGGNNLVSGSSFGYTPANSSVGTTVLSTSFGYAANSIDLASIQNSAGQSFQLGYNAYHQITSITNGLGQVTTLSWLDPGYNLSNTYYESLTGIQLPGGQSVNLAYDLSRYRTNYPTRHWVPGTNYGRLQTISWSPSGRSFTINAWTNGLPWIVTDDRGVTVTNTWDGLNRLTSTLFPDGTYISNSYDRLDLGAAQDRLGNWTYYTHDGLEHLTAITNANQAVTLLSWCSCGDLESILDATGTNLTTLNYDNQGNLTNIAFPDNSSLTYQYDLAGRMTQVADGAGRFLQLNYNDQNLVTNVTGAYGTVESVVYDAANRPVSITDANGVTVSNTFDAINELLTRTWPDGISEGFGYSAAGLIAYTNRDQQATCFTRDGAGRILAITNANQEVVQFAYDSLNNVTNLTDGLQHTTTWQYNQYGWLTNKVDGLNRNAFQFAYNANGWVTNRWTPQMGNTAYAYDNVGNLTSIVYAGGASSTSPISFAYDALNQLTNMMDAVGTTAFSYTPVGQLASENGPWPNDTVSYLYSQMLRTNLTLTQASGSWAQGYGYDSAWRMTQVVSPAGTFGYTFNGGASPLVTGITLPNGASIANSYDSLARLKETDLNNQWGHTLDGYTYGLDALGLRTNIVRNFGLMSSTVNVSFDNIGQITSWIARETNGTPRWQEQLGFGFDAADNLHLRTNNALVQTFNVDAANELTNVGRTGTLTVSGNTPAPASSVTVNGQAARTYTDFTFASANNALTNSANTFTVVARNAYGVTVTNNLTANLPTNAVLGFDNNGNLTNDSARSFSYNPENELTNVFVSGQWKSEFVYDGLERRRIARDYTWQGGAWAKTNEVHYIYDGYLLVQERDTNNNVLVTYTRGLDLSGSLQGAGGIGGLLARTDSNGSTFYHADANGNITALMDGNENIVARYLYGPFGKLIGKWGTMADVNEMQFSSKPKYHDLYDFGFRWYSPDLGRWPNQDPIQERGGINLYRAVRNNPVNIFDPLGLQSGWDIDVENVNGAWAKWATGIGQIADNYGLLNPENGLPGANSNSKSQSKPKKPCPTSPNLMGPFSVVNAPPVTVTITLPNLAFDLSQNVTTITSQLQPTAPNTNTSYTLPPPPGPNNVSVNAPPNLSQPPSPPPDNPDFFWRVENWANSHP
jgi:RHS repeat-associated protein